jgi:hypothetical protein
MSLIQSALEKANMPDAEEPKIAVPVAEEPRMQNIQFYETVEKTGKPEYTERKRTKPRQAAEIKTVSLQFFSRYRLSLIIGALVLGSLIAGRLFIAAETPSRPLEIPTPAVVMKEQSPITQKTVAQVKLTLTGITEAEGVQLALINNQVVGVGDRLREQAVVKTITNNAVTLEWQGRQVTLTL